MPYEYFEFDETASKDDRRRFDELVESLSQVDDYVGICFDMIDRLGRDSFHPGVGKLVRLARAGKFEMHFPNDNSHIHKKGMKALQRTQFSMGMVFAEYYSAAISGNVKRRSEEMVAKGHWLHHAPLGYRNVNLGTEDEPQRSIVVDELRAPYIIKAFELRSEGLPYEAIADQLYLDGFRSAKGRKLKGERRVNKSTIEKICRNPFYHGVMRRNGVEMPHKYEPLISRTLFNKCQTVKQERAHSATKYNSGEFALKGIPKCGRCGHAISSYAAKGRVYMRCAKSTLCRNPNTSEASIMPAVIDDLSAMRIPEEYIGKVIDKLKAAHDSQSSYFDDVLSANRAEYDTLKRRLDVLYSDRLDGRISATKYDEMAAGIEARQQELNDQSKNLTSNNKDFLVTTSYLLDLCQRAAALFNSSKPELQRELLEVILSNAILSDKSLDYVLPDPFDVVVKINKNAPKGADGKFGWPTGALNELSTSSILGVCRLVVTGSPPTLK